MKCTSLACSAVMAAPATRAVSVDLHVPDLAVCGLLYRSDVECSRWFAIKLLRFSSYNIAHLLLAAGARAKTANLRERSLSMSSVSSRAINWSYSCKCPDINILQIGPRYLRCSDPYRMCRRL